MRKPLERREFLEALGALSIASCIAKGLLAADERQGDMIYRKLGRTGERVSAIGLVGFHIGNPPTEDEGIRLIRTAVDRGINFLDNCWDYQGGKCETWMGKALRDGYRQKVFLMTKFDGRTKASTAKQIDESLQRLCVVDYKTADRGDKPQQTHRKGDEWIDLQLPLYRHLVRAAKLPARSIFCSSSLLLGTRIKSIAQAITQERE